MNSARPPEPIRQAGGLTSHDAPRSNTITATGSVAAGHRIDRHHRRGWHLRAGSARREHLRTGAFRAAGRRGRGIADECAGQEDRDCSKEEVSGKGGATGRGALSLASVLLVRVPTEFDGERSEVRCLPGDITVTEIPTGYLVGRALERKGPGPWWTYILIADTFDDAVRQARTLATSARVRAWVHKGGDDYEPLPPAPD
jgi:hypothetical protein